MELYSHFVELETKVLIQGLVQDPKPFSRRQSLCSSYPPS